MYYLENSGSKTEKQVVRGQVADHIHNYYNKN